MFWLHLERKVNVSVKELFIKTEQQRKWLEKLKTLESFIKAHAQENDEQSLFPHDNINKLREIGYTKITLPKEYGGEGLNVYDAILFQETLGSYDGSTALSIGWTLSTVGDIYETKNWPQEKLEEFAKAVAEGAIINKIASEIVTGSPVRGGRPATTAIKKGNKWVINGRKCYATCSPELDYFLVTAWVPELENTGIFLIHKDTKGLSIDETWDVVAMKATGSHDVVLDQVEVDESALVEVPNYKTGFKLNGWLLIVPATYLGIAQAARDYAVEFANRHSPNSIQGTIASLPNVQVLIGEMELLLTQARFAIYGAAQSYIDLTNKGELSAEEAEYMANAANVAKYTVINNAINVVDKAMRVVGAKSLQRTNPLQRYYRDVRAGLHNPPMDDLTIKKLAEFALKK